MERGTAALHGPDQRPRRHRQDPAAAPCTARTQDELDTRLRRLRNAADTTVDNPTNLTVSSFLTYWLDDVLPLERKAPATEHSYREVCRLYIDPHIGRIELTELTPMHIRRMMTALADKGYAPSTVARSRKTLSRALRTAVRDGLVVRNVAQLVDGVAIPRSDKQTLTPEQAARLLEVADEQGHGTLIAVLLGLGLRRGEALGLRWRDIDLDAATLTVNGGIAKDLQARPFWSPMPKTATSRRRLHLPEAVTASLRRHKTAQARAEARLHRSVGPGLAVQRLRVHHHGRHSARPEQERPASSSPSPKRPGSDTGPRTAYATPPPRC